MPKSFLNLSGKSSKIVHRGVRAIMTGDAYRCMASLFVFLSLPSPSRRVCYPPPKSPLLWGGLTLLAIWELVELLFFRSPEQNRSACCTSEYLSAFGCRLLAQIIVFIKCGSWKLFFATAFSQPNNLRLQQPHFGHLSVSATVRFGEGKDVWYNLLTSKA